MINFYRWIKRLFSKRPVSHLRNIHWPTREEMALLPPFEAMDLKDIVPVSNATSAEKAYDELMREEIVGFDTESKPTFVKGHVSTGPHVAQFSTLHRAYVFMLHDPKCRKVAATLIQSKMLKKVGFGLSNDIRRIRIKLGVEPSALLDLETLFRAKGHGHGVGVKVAIAIVLKRRFSKPRKISTSDWSKHPLSAAQLLYAANDAYAAIRSFHALESTKAIKR